MLAILADRKPDSRGMSPYSTARVVLGAIQNIKLPISNDGRRIEHVVVLPLDRPSPHGTLENGPRLSGQHRLGNPATGKRSDRPSRGQEKHSPFYPAHHRTPKTPYGKATEAK